ncbi:pimeloyl-ACP methyl ester carboxylesterase [Nitrobacteraceae bacterium AZCC 1564]
MTETLDLTLGSLGLHCLRKVSSGKCIIFAHGILSDGESAWGKPPWPQLLVDDGDLKEHGVYVFSYRTSLKSGSFSIGDATRTLKAHFDLENLWSQDQIVFVGHSMGGIIIRKFITTNQTRLAFEKIGIGLFLSPLHP